jgi:hypothetical protein
VTDIGRYTAVATLAYGIDSRQFMTADTAFWVIPWKILLVFFAFIGGFVAFVSWAIRMYVRRMLMLAGVAPAVAAPIVAPKKSSARTKSVTAPLEAGILDLRSRLENTHSISAVIETLSLLFLSLLVWFFKGALAPSREYAVTIEEDGQRVTVAEGETPYQATAPQAAIGKGTKVSLVNRSGSGEAVAQVATILSNAGFAVATTTPPVEGIEEKTVVVYSPSVADMAVAVSELLDNALLSAFTSSASSSSSIVVYVGSQSILTE